MKRFRFILIVTMFILALFLGACTSTETGDIVFVSPQSGQKMRDDFHGLPVQTKPLIVSSTFDTDKVVRFSVGDQGEETICVVKRNSLHHVCPPVTLNEPGEHFIRAEVQLTDGGVRNSYMVVEWEPYTAIDQIMLDLSYTSSPVGGYLMVIGILILMVSALAWILTRNKAIVTLVDSILLVIVFISLFFLPSSEQAVLVGCWTMPFLIIMILVSVWFFSFPKPKLVVHRSDGTPVFFDSGPFSRGRETMVIQADELNKDYVVVQKTQGGDDGYTDTI